MTAVNLDTFASILATYARFKLRDVHRAALLVRCIQQKSMVAAILGNDGYLSNATVRREIELLRQHLHDAAIEELAFGVSADGHSWALLVKAHNQKFQTEAAKAFRAEMLRADLEEAVWAAWRTVCGVTWEDAGWPTIRVDAAVE
jgi:hypothetical protein